MQKKYKYIIISMLLVVFSIALYKTAWIAEDSYITFRTIDNFVSGHGLTWNIDERVQTYTHPLWMFILSAAYWVFGKIYYPAIIISFLASICALGIFGFLLAESTLGAVFGMVVFVSSKAFTDFSTSGLENPLTHLILAIFLLYFLKPKKNQGREPRIFMLCLIACMGVLNRMDTLLLFLPAIGFELFNARSVKALIHAFLAFLPFIIWEIFSLFYYGTLFPNTAYAKLSTGIGSLELIRQGGYYLLNSLKNDPLTLTVISASLVVVPIIKKDGLSRCVLAGIFLYLVYIFKIGGDFMSGRFLTPPLFCSVVLISRMKLDKKTYIALTFAAMVTGLFSAQIPLLSSSDYGGPDDMAGIVDKHGISDERRAYYPHVGMLKSFKKPAGSALWPDHRWAATGQRARKAADSIAGQTSSQNGEDISLYQIGTTVGLYGFFAGPRVHIVDRLALADPFLARLPLIVDDWRPGHYKRIIPVGYLESLVNNKNMIMDKNLSKFYEKLHFIIKGPLLSGKRCLEIIKLSLGEYNNLIYDSEYVKSGESRRINLFMKKSFNDAAFSMTASVDKSPEDPMRYVKLFYNLGVLFQKQGNMKRAVMEYKTALAINPFFVKAINRLAQVYVKTDNLRYAVSLYKRMGAILPDQPEIYYNLACLYAKGRQVDKSLEMLKTALAKGYKNWKKIKNDKDLENIRMLKRYKSLMAGH